MFGEAPERLVLSTRDYQRLLELLRLRGSVDWPSLSRRLLVLGICNSVEDYKTINRKESNMAQEQLLLTDQDYERLSQLVHPAGGEAASLLDEELGRATIVPQKQIPRDVVTMNSRIRFVDEEAGKESEVTLVYPKDADVTERKVSILAPVGTALIGLRLGQSINWPMPNGKHRKLKVISIVYQPEASGDWDL